MPLVTVRVRPPGEPSVIFPVQTPELKAEAAMLSGVMVPVSTVSEMAPITSITGDRLAVTVTRTCSCANCPS